VSHWPHRVRFSEPLREARIRIQRETFVSPSAALAQSEERYRAGFEAGQKSIAEEMMRQRAQLLEIQNNVIRSIERSLPTLATQWEKDLVALAFEAARRVVHGTPISRENIEAVVRNGVAALRDAAEYQVRLNPEDLTLLLSIQSPVLPSPSNNKVKFLADPAIKRADCIIQTTHGAIELNREKMFQKLEEVAA
jgi:flagellar biosynthesis/type III secretory pathway protein FliH